MAKSKAYYATHPRSSTAVQKQQVQAQNKEEQEKKKASIESNIITSASQLKSRESYDIYDSKTNKYIKTSLGDKLRDSIAHETLSYDKKNKVWVTKKGKYIVRKKR